MLKNKIGLTFSSLLPSRPHNKTITLDIPGSKMMANSQMNGTKSVQQNTISNDKCKVIKLIGDKEHNIQEIVSEINCICGCKKEFKNILVLLMDKIYRLRQQRNSLKEKIEFSSVPQINIHVQKRVNTATNTEQIQLTQQKRNQLNALIGTDNQNSRLTYQINNSLKIDGYQDVFRTQPIASVTFHRDFNETNLLESPVIKKKVDEEESDLQIEEEIVLKQKDSNSQNSLKNMSVFLKKNKFDLKTLENYIEKVNCARVIDSYEIKKRNRDLF